MRRLAPRLLACALLSAGAAQASPFTVDRFLAQARLGQVSIDPAQRWLVAPIAAPYKTAPRWDLEDDAYRTITQLAVFDLAAAGPAKIYPPRVGGPDDWGYSPGPYSPSGAKMAVTRARGRTLEVGVLDLATGQAVWTGLNPIDARIGRAVQWRSEAALIVVAKDPQAITLAGLNGWQTQARWIDQWRATDEGRLGVTVTGSGRYLDRNPVSTATRLVSVSAATGQGRVLTRGDFLDVEVAPGGRYAALFANGEPVRPDPATPLSTSDSFRRHRLTLVDLDDGEVWSPCPRCDLAPYLLAWSPRGSDLLIYARDEAAGWADARYWRLTPKTRVAAPLQAPSVKAVAKTTGPGYITPRADWMGETPLIQARPVGAAGQGPGDADWFAWRAAGPVNLTAALPPGPRTLEAVSAEAIVVSTAGQLHRIDAAGRATALGPGRRVQGPGFAGSERLAYNLRPSVADLVVALDQDRSAVPAVLHDGRVETLGVQSPAGESLQAVAPRLRLAATVRRDAHGVQTVNLAQAGRPVRALATINADLAQVDFAQARPIAHKGPRGEALTSWLYLPPDRPPGTRFPWSSCPIPAPSMTLRRPKRRRRSAMR
jgi:dipeptidyl aminopeptidase/acylaminoacyl peptidase